ncbi:MAG: J domain-containing protein [Hyphomicrobium sp.]
MSALDPDKKKTNKKINYYSVLGVSNVATDLELKIAFDEKIRGLKSKSSAHVNNEETHPRWVLINEAYNTLSKPETRRKFDEELQFILETGKPEGRENFIAKFNTKLKRFGGSFRFFIILISVLLLVSIITYMTFKEISNPSTRIQGIKDGLLLYSLMSFFLLIISYYQDLPSRMRVWFRVVSICILAFCFTVALGLFAIPTLFNF